MNPESRVETDHPPVVEIVTGHFREGVRYGTLRSRGTDDYLLIATLGGSGRYGLEGDAFQSHSGDLTLYHPHTPQEYATDPQVGRWDLLWAHFRPRPHWHPWLQWPEVAPGLGLLRLEDSPAWREIVTLFKRVNRTATGAAPRQTSWAMHALEEMLLRCDALNPQRRDDLYDPRVQDALEYLSRNLDVPVTLQRLSREVGLSPSRLSHLFRAQTGASPMAFLEAQRLERAAQLLRLTSLNVEEVAREVGFPDPFYFSSRFKRRFQQAPREFRRSI